MSVRTPENSRYIGRPRHRWQDNSKDNFEEIELAEFSVK
jgi:hypothetical protein